MTSMVACGFNGLSEPATGLSLNVIDRTLVPSSSLHFRNAFSGLSVRRMYDIHTRGRRRIPFSLPGSCYCNHILFKNKQMDKPKISSLSSYALAAPPLYLLLKQCTHSQEVFRLSHCLFRTSAHRQMSIVDPDKQYLGVSGRVPRCCADKSIMH